MKTVRTIKPRKRKKAKTVAGWFRDKGRAAKRATGVGQPSEPALVDIIKERNRKLTR